MKSKSNNPKAKRQLFVVAILILYWTTGCFPAYIDRTRVITNSAIVTDTNIIRIKKLLVLAYGNTSSRIITGNVYSALQEKMKQKGATSNFEFKSQPADTALIEEMNKTNITGYEGCLLIIPGSSASIDFTKVKTGVYAPTGSGGLITGAGYGSAYEETYTLHLFDAEKKLIYSGEMKLHIDPSKKLLYKNVTGKMISELNAVNIRLW